MFKQLQKNLFLAILLFITLVFIWLIKAYLLAIFWAAVLAILFYPVKLFFLKIMPKRESLSALLTVAVMLVIVFVPLYALGLSVVYETVGVYKSVVVNDFNITQSLNNLNEKIPVISWLETFGLERSDINNKVSEVLQALGHYVVSGVKNFSRQSLRFLLNFFVMIYVLYFFLRDGKKLLGKLQHFLPLGDRKEARLFKRFVSTVRATIKGTLIIALVQGFIGAILFWLVGISAPILWGALMSFLSIIPAVGSFVIWGPAGLLLIIGGSLGKGLIVLLVGALVISSVDNVLRPPLVGRDTAMPDALVLLSTLGGLTMFGISGFVIGPVIAAFFISIWNMFAEEYSQELSKLG